MTTRVAVVCSRTMPESEEISWREECRAQLRRDVLTRIKYGFCHVHKPVLDDGTNRAFVTMSEYRAWCERNLPGYLGYRAAIAR